MWVDSIELEQASGALERMYRGLARSWGGVDGIVQSQSLQPRALRALLSFYNGVMHGDCDISLRQREMIAVTVSSINACHY